MKPLMASLEEPLVFKIDSMLNQSVHGLLFNSVKKGSIEPHIFERCLQLSQGLNGFVPVILYNRASIGRLIKTINAGHWTYEVFIAYTVKYIINFGHVHVI